MNEEMAIARFVESRAEDAFAALVHRHVDFVYATALRQIGDPGMAEEITQNVFVALARKAATLAHHKTIAGWLYQAVHNEARQRARSELRHRRREHAAASIHLERMEGRSIWEPLVPLLDEGLQAMDEPDRTAVLLHCLEGRPFREVGEALGVGEDAARKRVNRALDQLTNLFRAHGFAVPAIAASAPLFTLATAAAAPSGAAAAAMAAAASAITGPGPVGVLIGGATYGLSKLMATTPLKVGITGALVATALTTTLLIQRATLARLESDNEAMRTQLQQIDQLQGENEHLMRSRFDTNELQRLRGQQSELMKLRDEVARLRADKEARANLHTNQPDSDVAAESVAPRDPPGVSTFRANVRESVGRGQTLVTGGWRTRPGQRMLVFVTPQPGFDGDPQAVFVGTQLIELSDEWIVSLGWDAIATETSDSSAYDVLSAGKLDTIMATLKETAGVNIVAGPSLVISDGIQGMVSVTRAKMIEGTEQTLGPIIGITPRIEGDGSSVDLEVEVVANLESSDASAP